MPKSLPPKPAFVVRAVSKSDVGMRRATNQDSVAISPVESDGVIHGDAFLMVADGMGAHAAGELASKIATDTVPHSYSKAKGDPPPNALRQAIRQANEKIHSKGSSSQEFYGMGTTCSCLVLTNGAAIVGHVGDSRVYRLRKGVLEQLTFDHSLVWEMAAASKVSEDKVPSCIPKNVITRSLGPHETVVIDLEGPHELEDGDTFLLCSDGLTGVVDDPLAGSVLSAMEPRAAAEALVNLANLRGGPDNISVVIAQVESADPEAERQACGGGSAAGRFPVRLVGIAAALVSLVACAGFFTIGSVPGMLASAVGFGAALVFSLASRQAVKPTPATEHVGDTLGNGPYRRTECGDHASAAGDLRDLVRELSALQSEEDTVRVDGSPPLNGEAKVASFLVDWGPLQELQQAADSAFDRGDFCGSIVQYAAIVAMVMSTVRGDDDTRRYPASDAVIS